MASVTKHVMNTVARNGMNWIYYAFVKNGRFDYGPRANGLLAGEALIEVLGTDAVKACIRAGELAEVYEVHES